MNREIKKLIIEALIEVVSNAPTKTPAFNQENSTKPIFDVWMNYANSVLQITSQHVNKELFSAVYSSIQSIAIRTDLDYNTKTITICQHILNFARAIIDL